MSLEDAYTKRYKMRLMGTGGATTVTTIPPLVLQREARRRGMTVAEFVEQFMVEAAFNSFDGVHYTFVRAGEQPKYEPPKKKPEGCEEFEVPRTQVEIEFDELRAKLKGDKQ